MTKQPLVRLTHPWVRDSKAEELRPASWDEALDRAAAGLRAAIERGGGDGVGMFSCSKATNEMNYAAQKFSRQVLGSNNVDSCNRT
jgi:predicted molibdopterin-dependent oxidoreductase YjgC